MVLLEPPVIDGSLHADLGRLTETNPGIFREVGATGLLAFGGYINEEFLPQLAWPYATRIYREMSDNDATIFSMLNAIDLLVRQVDWRTDPADESPLAQEIADHCDSCRLDMEDTWPDTISSNGSVLPFGFCLAEKVYKRRLGPLGGPPTEDQPFGQPPSKHKDGRIGWANLPIRAQETIYRWEYARTTSNEKLVGAYQRTVTHPAVTIPMGKLLHFRTTALKANPLGRSILRGAYRSWYMKRRIEEIEGIGIERDLAGLPVAKVPPYVLDKNAPENLKDLANTMREAVKNVRRNEAEGLLMPYQLDDNGHEMYAFELLTTGGQRQFDTTKVIERYDQRILLTALADFLLLGAQGVGSLGFSMGTTRVELFSAALDAWLTMIATEYTENAYRELVELNGWPLELTPTLKHAEVQEVDLAKLFLAILQMSQAGSSVFPDPILEDWLLDQLDAPHTSAEEKALNELAIEAEVQNRMQQQAQAEAKAQQVLDAGGGPADEEPAPPARPRKATAAKKTAPAKKAPAAKKTAKPVAKAKPKKAPALASA